MKEKNICPEKDTRCAAPSVTVAYCAEPCTVGLWRGRLVRETTQLCHHLGIETQNADNCTGLQPQSQALPLSP